MNVIKAPPLPCSEGAIQKRTAGYERRTCPNARALVISDAQISGPAGQNRPRKGCET
ncbi:MAG: hypothetical protein JWN07_1277 [Hyphomicrobiales bacterium]|nr:hypothetical protein [Hyphomicrobiales bacterium]